MIIDLGRDMNEVEAKQGFPTIEPGNYHFKVTKTERKNNSNGLPFLGVHSEVRDHEKHNGFKMCNQFYLPVPKDADDDALAGNPKGTKSNNKLAMLKAFFESLKDSNGNRYACGAQFDPMDLMGMEFDATVDLKPERSKNVVDGVAVWVDGDPKNNIKKYLPVV